MRVLFLTHRLPYAANRGDRIRTLYLLRHLSAHADVDLVSLVHSAEEDRHTPELRGLVRSVATARVRRWSGYARGLATLPTSRTLTHALLHAPGLRAAIVAAVSAHRPDLVITSGTGIAHAAMAPPLDRIPHVLDMVDVDSEKWRALGASGRPPMSWIYAREGRCLAAFEAAAARQARAVLVVSARERDALARLEPSARVHVVPNGVDLAAFGPGTPPAAQPAVSFCGVMNYAPNEQGALWFAQTVWPHVRAARPEATLTLIGSHPTAALQRLSGSDATITVTGTVPDVRPYLWESAVSVAPLHVARGIQNKVLEALAAGVPCVITPAVAAGLPDAVRGGCRVASAPDEFARAVLELLALTPEERRAMAGRAEIESLSWAAQLRDLMPILAAAAR